jgi:hypothetical protein
LVGYLPHLGRGIRTADPFGRRYGIGTVTVVTGVVAVTPTEVVTVTETSGVLTVTVAGAVTPDVGIGSVGTEAVGTWRVVGNTDATTPAVDEGTDAGVVSPPEPYVDAGATLTPERSTGSRRRRTEC